MKSKTISLAFAGLFLLANCTNKAKQPKEETLWDTPVTQTEQAEAVVSENNTVKTDTTIYEWPATTAHLDNAHGYFRQNNKFKDWDKNDKRQVYVRCVVETNGKISSIVKISGDKNEKLRNEAVRLVKEATLSPAENEAGIPIRSYWTNIIDFPPK